MTAKVGEDHMVSRVAIIPARWASRRFPGKPLALLQGKPMILHVAERVRQSAVFDSVQVATDDDRIESALVKAAVSVVRTREDHRTGTERVAEAVAELPENAIIFNVQGDEPMISPSLLVELMQHMLDDPECRMATAAHPETDPAAYASPHVVKVVRQKSGEALYFSRAGIPATDRDGGTFLRHIGIYAFRQAALQQFIKMPAGRLEQQEGLEQLRALENGIPIHVHLTDYRSVGVDTPEDLIAVERQLQSADGPHSGNERVEQ